MNKVTILFDDECTMCLRFKQGLALIDRNDHINFLSLNDDESFKNFPFIKKSEAKDKVHLIRGEEIYVGGEVISELVKLYPSVSKLAWLLDTQAGKKAMDLFYTKLEDLKKKCRRNKCCRNKSSYLHEIEARRHQRGLALVSRTTRVHMFVAEKEFDALRLACVCVHMRVCVCVHQCAGCMRQMM